MVQILIQYGRYTFKIKQPHVPEYVH